MDSPLVDLEPTRQADILRHQLQLVRRGLDSGSDNGFLAALMIEWHACYYRQAFEPIREECRELIDDVRSGSSYWSLGRTLSAPLELALLVNLWGDPVNLLPRELDVKLWSNDPTVSHRMRTCLYWAAPLIDAEALIGAFAMSWMAQRPYDQLAFVIALCKGGFDVLWRLREQLPPDDGFLDDAIQRRAVSRTVANPFAAEVISLTGYMFQQSIRVIDGWEAYPGLRKSTSPYVNREVGVLASVGLAPTFVMGASIDCAELDLFHREVEDAVPLVGAQIVGSSWRRLVRYSDGACGVEKYDCESGAWRGSAMPVGEFITRVRGAAA